MESTNSAMKPHPRTVTKERLKLLRTIDDSLNKPMLVLGIVWLVLLVAQLVYGSKPWSNDLTVFIWIVFVADFLIRLTLAPKKVPFLKKNWLVAVSLLLPALSILRLGTVLAMMPSWQVLIFRL